MAEEDNKSPEEKKQHEAEHDTSATTPDKQETAVEEAVDESEAAEKSSKKEDAPKKEEEIEEMTTLHERTIAALSYVSFLAIVPFYLKKDSKFCRFHGKQGLLVAMIFFFASLLLVLDFLNDLALIIQFIIFVVMGLAALSGKWKKLPWIYEKACQLEESLSLKTKEEEAEEATLKPKEGKK